MYQMWSWCDIWCLEEMLVLVLMMNLLVKESVAMTDELN